MARMPISRATPRPIPRPAPRRIRRALLLLAVLAAPCVAAPEPPAAFDADWILQALARPAPSRTPFVELKASPMLRQPLRVQGEYRREADGRLVRQVTAPYAETTTLADGQAIDVMTASA